MSQALLYSTVDESSSHSHPSTVEGRRDASEYLPSSPPPSSVEESLTHLHLLYGGGMRVGQDLLYTIRGEL